MEYSILNRYTGKPIYTADIEADENTLVSVKLGLAVKWSIKNRADLIVADLSGADLKEVIGK